MNPFIQWGFAGFAFALLWLVYWLIKNVLKAFKDNGTVISANTATIAMLSQTSEDVKGLSLDIKDKLMESPCMLPEEIKDQIRILLKDRRNDIHSHSIDTEAKQPPTHNV
jgi:hypothetical protein